jgi:signal transduction histidine kinase
MSDPRLTPPSDPGRVHATDDGSMSYAQAFPRPIRPASRLALVHRRAIHAITGALLTWVYGSLLLVALPLALSMTIVWVGIPMLVGLLAVIRGCAAIERRLAVVLLDVEIPAPPRVGDMKTTLAGQLRAVVTHGATWRGMGFTAVRMITGFVAFLVVTIFVGSGIAFLLAPFVGGTLTINDWVPERGWSLWWAPVVGALLVGAGWYLSSLIGMVHGWIAPVLLGPSEADRVRVLESRTAKLSAQTQLARELHDSVGHTMTSVVVQAGAARRVFDSNPAFAREALGEIETSARQALTELDYMIGMLRNDQANPTNGYAPLPTLFDVERLILGAQRNGLTVTHALVGDPATVPMQLSREAFRIVQEGFTNATKHAPGAATDLKIDIGLQELTIVMTNPVRPTIVSADRVGHGLRGIGERVNALGGVMWVGPVEDTHVLRVVVPFDPFGIR